MVMASTNKKLGVALVGVGGMGRRWLSAVQNTGAVALRFVCDKDIESAQKIAGGISGCRASDDWERVADSPDIDVAIVALPHVLLAPVSSVFLKNKKHVLCEKPGGMVPQDIKRNIALAKRNNVRYMIGFNHRFHDGFQKMRKLFEEGAIGDIMFIRARYGFGGRVGYEKEWRFKKEISGGGELIDQGVHMIDMARWFLADVSEAKGFTSDAFWHGGAEDNAFVILRNKKGISASIHVSWTQWKPLHSFELYGTEGYFVVEGLGKKYGGEERLTVGKRTRDFKAEEQSVACDSNAEKSLEKELCEFVSAIKENRESDPSGSDGFEVLKIVHTIYGSEKK